MSNIQTKNINVQAIAGKTLLKSSQLEQLNVGDILKLDRTINEPVDICANGALVAKGRVMVSDGKLGIIITEIIKNGVD